LYIEKKAMPNFSDITSYISNLKPYIEMLNKLYYMSSREVSDVYAFFSNKSMRIWNSSFTSLNTSYTILP
jgi:hypothetical protein